MKILYYLTLLVLIIISSAVGQVQFIEMAQELNITEHQFSCGVGIVDLTGDGRSEIVITNHNGPDRLYIWQESTYVEQGQVYGLNQAVQDHHAIMLTDVDKNYWPDFYITGDPYCNIGKLYVNYGHPPFVDMAESYNLRDVEEMGSSFFQFNPESELAVLCGGNLMVRTGQTFVDITEGSGFETITNVHCPLFFDMDGDNDDDLYVAGNWHESSGTLFRNNGDTTFTDISQNTDEGGFPTGAGACFGDIDNDGDFDLYITSSNVNSMWENDGTGYFSNISDSSNTGYGGFTRGANFGDFDNDGDLDLFVNRAYDPNMILLNDGDGVFVDYSEESGVEDTYNGFGSAIGDLNNDGQLDIVAVNCDNEPNLMYINQNQNDSYLKIKLVGLYPNTLALGAIVDLYGLEDDSTGYVPIGKRQITSASSMFSFDDPIVHFGTGNYEILRAIVTFNSLRVVDTCGFEYGRLITIFEDSLVSIDDPINQLPANYLSLKSYPNPFNNSLRLSISGGTEREYRIEIYDLLGRPVKADKVKSDYSYSAIYTWDATDYIGKHVPSGIYFIKVINGQYRASTKAILLK